MFHPVRPQHVLDVALHLRSLYRTSSRRHEREAAAHAVREAFARDLIANLRRGSVNPTPRLMFEMSRHFRVTMQGAYRLFGYELTRIQYYDFSLNASRTRVIESYPFQRDAAIDVPAALGDISVFTRNAFMREVVPRWQQGVRIRSVDGVSWQHPGMVYVQIGTEDSQGLALPPGAIASVQPISEEERDQPRPERIYLLQLGDGYACCGCTITKGKLSLLLRNGGYQGRHEFFVPEEVQILGRVRMFATALPLRREERPQLSLGVSRGAPLLAPWQQASLQGLFAAESLRFRRPELQFERVRSIVEQGLQTSISQRTLRRYRHRTDYTPHTATLIGLSLAYGTRYTDVLRVLKYLVREDRLHSLENLLDARTMADLPIKFPLAATPEPAERWSELLNEWGEWALLLSLRFPDLSTLSNRIMRLQQSEYFSGLDALIPAGSALLLEELTDIPDTRLDRGKLDWERPVYALQEGEHTFCGYLEVQQRELVLIPHPHSRSRRIALRRSRIDALFRVTGAAMPA